MQASRRFERVPPRLAKRPTRLAGVTRTGGLGCGWRAVGCSGISAAVPDQPHNIARRVQEHAERYPDRDAIVDADRRLSYAALEERVSRAAAALRAAGIASG